MLYLFSAVSASFDFTVALIPIFVVRKLQMSRQTKIAAVCLLGMACMYVFPSIRCIHATIANENAF